MREPSASPRPSAFTLAVTFALVQALAIGLYWRAFDATPSLPTALYGAPLALPLVMAAAVAGIGRRSAAAAFCCGAAVLPLAAFARVQHDVALDPGTHNLWPFEIAIAFGVGLPAALAGALGVWLWRRLAARGGPR